MKLLPVKVLVLPLLSLIIGITQGCHKKSIPIITSRSIEPAAPKTIGTNYNPDTIAGKNIFTARCGRCHGLPDIAQYNENRWDIILSSMIPKARLSKEQGVHVTAYIKLNSAD